MVHLFSNFINSIICISFKFTEIEIKNNLKTAISSSCFLCIDSIVLPPVVTILIHPTIGLILLTIIVVKRHEEEDKEKEKEEKEKEEKEK
jgi:hypothetical protein